METHQYLVLSEWQVQEDQVVNETDSLDVGTVGLKVESR